LAAINGRTTVTPILAPAQTFKISLAGGAKNHRCIEFNITATDVNVLMELFM
jgi:hypothetical protein